MPGGKRPTKTDTSLSEKLNSVLTLMGWQAQLIMSALEQADKIKNAKTKGRDTVKRRASKR